MNINKLWINAMNKLKEDKSRFDDYDMHSIFAFLEQYELKHDRRLKAGVFDQIRTDIQLYKKFDCIAMWVGDGGLIEHEPEFIIELVGLFGIEE